MYQFDTKQIYFSYVYFIFWGNSTEQNIILNYINLAISTVVSYRQFFLCNTRTHYDSNLFHRYSEDDMKLHRKEMDMIHCSEDHDNRKDTLEMWKIIVNSHSW